PPLLRLPGALGTSPDAMRYLQRLVTFDPQLDQPITAEMRDPEYLAACITRALSELLDAVTSEAPLILVIEDAQWLDRVSTMVLGDLLSERRERRLLLLATWRATEDPMPALPFPDRTRAIRLLGLATSDAERLLTAQFRELSVPTEPQVVAWGVSTAQGNPFFLHELARHYAVHREVGQVPTSLLELLHSRLANLGTEAEHLLAALALLGPYASVSRAVRMVQMGRRELLLALSQLESTSLVSACGSSLTISHPLIGELILQRATPAVRQLLHRCAAECLAAESEATSPGMALSCAEHWLHAEEALKATQSLRRASSQLAAIGQHEAAIQLLQRAFDIAPSSEERIHIGLTILSLAESSVDSALTRATADRLFAECARHSFTHPALDTIRLYDLMARWRSGEESLTLEAAIRDLLLSPGPRVRLEAARLALVLADTGPSSWNPHVVFEDACSALELLTADERSDNPIELIYHTAFGDIDRAINLALARWEILRQRLAEVGALSQSANIVVALGRCGMRPQALAISEDAYQAAVAVGSRRLQFTLSAFACAVALSDCALDEAKLWHERSIAARGEHEHSQVSPVFLLNEIRLRLKAGEDDQAEACYRKLLELLPESPNSGFCVTASSLLLCSKMRRRGSATEEELGRLREACAQRIGNCADDCIVEAYADALIAVGESSTAEQVIDRHLAGRRSKRAFTGVRRYSSGQDRLRSG
ncbi:MAG TPA: hypothetical protein VEB21_16800, partial [Terriglobales bacterium]|nr:hypothetical protein [Terriglobales bacterium]